MFGAIEYLGQRVVWRLDAFGDFCRFCGTSLSWLFEGTALRWKNLRLLAPQMYAIGTLSIPVVMITGTFIGMVLAVQTVMQFKAIGREAAMGSIVNLSVLRELGPVLAGVMLAGRVGGGLTAELGTMRVTEQIDALRAMGSDPHRVLVVPRFLACVLLIPALVLYADFMGILGGYVISVYVYNVNAADFWDTASRSVEYFDVFYGPIKSVFFGMAISLICCYKGFRSAPGAAGVGKACTEAFVASAMVIIGMDFFLGMFLNWLYTFLWGTSKLAI
jgi:phospholipid/cholesterol/gamma-HCH transport system permease protein